ncbi:MAG: prolipoprotein diacylglyceryl transferase [Ilumatobacteraceae bacterium]|nr:prolipoprotein diacylglyceryl transferase [Ilumatobacteraceae bacterium]
MNFLSYIPSPGSSAIHLGPLQLRAYGLMIALGVILGVRLWGKRMTSIGIGGPEQVNNVAMWAVPAGVIGARLYHVATEWSRFSDHPIDIIKIWKGGLGIPGGMLLGIIVGVWALKRENLPVAQTLWAVAPALPLAQAVGRWGNWWNQELFGKATTLPWGLRVDADKVLDAGYPAGTLFHPTFLYESLWNLALTVILIFVGRRMLAARPGRLLAVYVMGYGIGRFWVEGLRIDATKEGGGLRLNQWTALILIVGAAVYFTIDASKARKAVRASEYRQEDVESV